MRRLTADIYKIAYKITGNKLIALSFALAYISLLNLITIYGLCLLLQGWQPELETIESVFKPPYVYGIFLLTVALNFWLMLPLQNLSKVKGKPYALAPVIIYSLASFLILFYTHFADKLF